MTYFRFKGKDDLWLGKFGKSERTLIPNELLTKKEIDKIKKDCPRLSVEKTFKEVELSPNKTYVNFGVRFENDTDHNSKLESRTIGRKLHIKEDNDVDDTDARDDYIYFLEKKLNRIKSVDKLRKTLEELGFTKTDGIDYNTWDNYYGDDASFDTWEKDDIVVNFWYDEKYRTIETRVR